MKLKNIRSQLNSADGFAIYHSNTTMDRFRNLLLMKVSDKSPTII